MDLVRDLDPELLPFDRNHRLRSGMRILRLLLTGKPNLVVMEGSGVAGGMAVIAARLLGGVEYVVSSGDAVAPFVGIYHRSLVPFAAVYERLLCRFSAGYIGWTPYLVGRALTFGAPRAMTAAGWSPPQRPENRAEVRDALGIPANAITFGIVGYLEWVDRIEYCYGLELVEAIRKVDRDDMRVLIVGDGPGLAKLREKAGEDLDKRVFLPGAVSRNGVPSYLAAMDVGVIPQSVDGVGSFRYTIKSSEYLAAGLPVVLSQTPMSYDLDEGWIWRLGGETPWGQTFISELTGLMDSITLSDIQHRRRQVPRQSTLFDLNGQQARAAAFLYDIMRHKQASA